VESDSGTSIRLDALDRRLLYELDHGARQSFSELARTVKQGRDRVEYRVQRFFDLGIIRNTTVVVNIYKLGFMIFKTYLKIENRRRDVEKFLSYLRKHPRVFWIALCEGSCDLTISIAARSPYEFFQIQSDILSDHSDIIIDYYVTTNAAVWAYRRKHLYKSGTHFFFYGGEPDAHVLDKLSYRILEQLASDARTPVQTLADKIGNSASVIRSRIEQLEEKNIILGYRLEINRAKIGYAFWKAQFVLRSHRTAELESFRDYCNSHRNVTYFIQQIGTYKVELEIEVSTYQEYFAVIDELKEKFAPLIRNVEMMLIKDEWYKWLPINQMVGA
jgi:DNA-binding Lrp family transcriptional regulator